MFVSDNSSRLIPIPPQDIRPFLDLDLKYYSPVLGAMRLFGETLKRTIDECNSGENELFAFTRTMQMMIASSIEIRLECLREEKLGADDKKNKLAQMIEILVFSNKNEYVFSDSKHESVNILWDQLRSFEVVHKILLKNFTLNLMVDLIAKNYELFNREEKHEWILQVKEEPRELFSDFLQKRNIQRENLQEKMADFKKRKSQTNEESDSEKVNSSSEERQSSAIDVAFSSNVAMIFPTSKVSLGDGFEQDLARLNISNTTPSSSPKSSSNKPFKSKTFQEEKSYR